MKKRFSKSIIAGLGFAAVCMGAHSTSYAAESPLLSLQKSTQIDPASIPAKSKKKQDTDIYIVHFRDQPTINFKGAPGLAATKPVAGKKLATASEKVQSYRSFLKGKQDRTLQNYGIPKENKVYEYTYAFNGMAARMTAAQAELLSRDPGVLTVAKDEMAKMDTDSTREFLELNSGRDSAWRSRYTGEDVIIGIIDSGLYPEHPSFADVETPSKGDRGQPIAYGPPPAGWTGDACEFGNTTFNPLDVPFTCNNKVLGARFYNEGFLRGGDPAVVLAPGSAMSARDDDGHGSAAASNAAGNFGVQAEIGGAQVGSDVMSGVAPRARIAVYKVCWDGPIITDNPADDDNGCFNSDSMAAIDQAVADGVDVINFSIGGASTNFASLDAVAFLFAADAGVHVATSAGNSGPELATVGAPGVVPWLTSVGAVNDNQNFALGIDVAAPASVAGLKIAIEGAGPVQLEDIAGVSGDLVVTVPADGCTALTNAADVTGKIAFIIRGGCAFDDKYASAEAAGATAIVVYNDGAAADRFNPFIMGGIDASRTIPGVMISHDDGVELAAASGVTASLDSANQVELANRVADFSSRGPNRGAFDIIKPDVVAPGVQILSAETTTENADAASRSSGVESFQYISGTSFSSPHVAGVLALIKQAHPDWSPAVARSAMMTTARQNLATQFNDDPATPFEIGAGHVVPNATFNPGLAYDADLLDYAAFTCGNNAQLFDDAVCDLLAGQGYSFDGSDLNLPSIGIGELVGTQSVTRTVTNVDDDSTRRHRRKPSVYKVEVEAPIGIDVEVSPRKLVLLPGESAEYTVTFTANNDARIDEFAFGSLTWVEHGKRKGRKHRNWWDWYRHGYAYGHDKKNARQVRSPIAVRPVALATVDEVEGTGVDGSVSIPVQFGYSGPYNAALAGISESFAFPDTVTEADGLNILCFDLPAADHIRLQTFDQDTTTPGGDDIDLRVFRVDDCAGFGNLAQIGSSGNATSNEVVDIANPTAGGYVFVIDFFAAAGGATSIDYTAWISLLLGDDGNATVTAPASATVGTTTNVIVDYTGLTPASRHLGVISHQDGSAEVGRTVISIDTN